MSTQPLPIDEFAKRLRGKYPGAYDSLSDAQLVQKVVNKYPEYKEHIASFAPTEFEQQSTPATATERINTAAGKVLSGAGLPTSLNDIPNWFQHFTGQAADSKPFYQPVADAIKNPTQENVVGAVPFVGPASVSMARDVRSGDYDNALGTLAGTIASAGVGGEVGPGIRAGKAEAVDALRTPKGKLTPVAKGAARVAGAGITGAVGHAAGLPEAGLVGAVYGPSVADAFLPNRPPPTDFHGGAYDPFTGESGKAVPIRSSPFFVGNNAAAYKAGLKGDAFSPPSAETVEAARQASAPDNVAVVPDERPAVAGDRPGSAWSLTRTEGLPEAAQRGQPGAINVLRQLKPTVVIPRGSDIETPSMSALRDSLGITQSFPQGNADPFTPNPPAAPQGNPTPFEPSVTQGWLKPRKQELILQ